MASLNLSLCVSLELLIPSSTLVHLVVENPQQDVLPLVIRWKPHT